jgi:hypothetical protein
MKITSLIATIATLVLPIIAALIVLWSDVQTIKYTKVDYREMAELKTSVTGQLSKNTEAIENLNRLISELLKERREAYGKEVSSN